MSTIRRIAAFIASVALVATALVVAIAWQVQKDVDAASCTNGSLTPLQVGIDSTNAVTGRLNNLPLCVGPIDFTNAPLHTAEGGKDYAFQKAVWVGADTSQWSEQIPSDLLTSSTAQHLIEVFEISPTSNNSYKLSVESLGSDEVSTQAVELTADADTINNHLVLVYGEAAATALVQYEIDDETNGASGLALSGQSLQKTTLRQVFPLSATGDHFEQSLQIGVDREYQVGFSFEDGSEVTKPQRDTSSPTRTSQSFTLSLSTELAKSAREDHRPAKITIKVSRKTTGTLKAFVQSIPSDGVFDMVFNRVEYGSCDAKGVCTSEKAGSFDAAGNYTGGNDYNGFKAKTRNTTSQTYGTTYGGSAYAVFDGLPTFPTLTPDEAYSAFLESVTLNGQRFFVPMPRPCVMPGADNQTSGQWVPKCNDTGDTGWGSWLYEEKKRYTCTRAWLFGVRNTSFSQDNSKTLACGFDPQMHPSTENAPETTKKKITDLIDGYGGGVLLDQDVTEGALAGSHIRVQLVNARSIYDSKYSLDDDSGYADNDSSIYAGNSYTRQIWRTRVKVEVSNLKVPNLEMGMNYQWTRNIQMHYQKGYGVDAKSQWAADGSGGYGASFQIYGHNDGYPKNQTNLLGTWIKICRDPQANNPDPRGLQNGCGWSRGGDELDDVNVIERKVRIRFKTINGYVAPQVKAKATDSALEQTTYSASDTADDYLKYIMPTYVSREKTYGSWKITSNGSYLIDVNASPLYINLDYYGSDGSPLDNFAAVEGLNVSNKFLVAIASKIPNTTNAFTGWTLQGVKIDGTVENLQEGLLPGALVDIRTIHLTTFDGNAIYSSLRLVATTDNEKDPTGPQLYNVAKRWGSPAQYETQFTFLASPGMTANLVANWVDSEDNKELVRNNIVYRLAKDQSRLSKVLESDISESSSPAPEASAARIALAANVASETDDVTVPLYLAYVTSQTGTFTKTLICDEPTDTAGWTKPAACDPLTVASQLPDRQDFRLKLTPTGESPAAPVYLEHGKDPVSLPSGSFSLSEEIKGADDQWSPSTVWAPTAGYSCTSNGTELVQNGVLTISDSVGAVSCSATNGAAALIVRAWNPSDGGTWRTDTTLQLEPSGMAAISWTSSGEEPASTKAVAAATPITLSATAPTDYTVIGFQQLGGDGSTWGPVSWAGNTSVPAAFVHSSVSTGTPAITLAAGAVGQLRAVVVPTEKIATVRFNASEMVNDIEAGPTWDDNTAAAFGLQLTHEQAGVGTFETTIFHGHTNQDETNPAGMAIVEKGLTYSCQIVAKPTDTFETWGVDQITGTRVTVDGGSCTVPTEAGEHEVSATFGKSAATVKVVDASGNPVTTEGLTVLVGGTAVSPGSEATLVTPRADHPLEVQGVPLGWHVASLTPASTLQAAPGTSTEITVTLDRPSFVLPLTGGRPADYFLIGGVLVAAAGALWWGASRRARA